MTESYFDILPGEALLNIIRHLSSKPRLNEWRHTIHPSDMLSVLSAPTPLAATARDCLEVMYTPWSCSFRSKVPDGYALKFEGILRTMIFFVDIVRLARPDISALYIDLETCKYSLVSTFIMEMFANHCSRLKTLVLTRGDTDFSLASLLANVSGQLEVLDISASTLSTGGIHAIAAHCRGLNKLRFWDVVFLSDSHAVWESLGPTLVALDFKANPAQKPLLTLQNVKKYCMQMNHLCLEKISEANEMDVVSEICTGLGPSLQCFQAFDCLITGKLGQNLMQTCPNVRIEVSCYHRDDNLSLNADFLKTVVANLCVLRLSKPQNMQHSALQDLARCENLTSLTVEYGRDLIDLFLALFGTVKKQFRTLEVYFIENDDWSLNFQPVVDVLASGTTAMKCLDISCELLAPGAFDALAEANPGMEDVKIRVIKWINRREDTTERQFTMEEAVTGVVRAFSKCPGLRVLIVEAGTKVFQKETLGDCLWWQDAQTKAERLELVDVACGKLMARRVYVNIFGVEYLR